MFHPLPDNWMPSDRIIVRAAYAPACSRSYDDQKTKHEQIVSDCHRSEGPTWSRHEVASPRKIATRGNNGTDSQTVEDMHGRIER